MRDVKAVRDRTRPPLHPGAILREDVLPGLDLSVPMASHWLGVSAAMLTDVLAGAAPVSPELALRLGKFCGNGPEVWLRMQATYDLWHAARDVDLGTVRAMQAA